MTEMCLNHQLVVRMYREDRLSVATIAQRLSTPRGMCMPCSRAMELVGASPEGAHPLPWKKLLK